MNGDQGTMDHSTPESMFVALKALQGIHQLQGDTQVVLADIVAYISGRGKKDILVEEAIRSDLRLRQLYKLLLQQQRVAFLPKEALAQDAAELDMRIGAGFRILFRRSRADSGQTYVIIELDEHSELDRSSDYMLFAEDSTDVVRLRFVATSGGRSQIILPSDDKKLKTIKNPDIELSLVPL